MSPNVKVGIVNARELSFTLNDTYLLGSEPMSGRHTALFAEGKIMLNGKPYDDVLLMPTAPASSFTLEDVTIGVNFHWERKENETFEGMLHLVIDNGTICAINELPVENYLRSVISSEMRADASLQLLKAHAVISRSWLISQLRHAGGNAAATCRHSSDCCIQNEMIRWYDREDHRLFDVCADDHCQRYQGITRATRQQVDRAVKETCGEVIMYGDEICDARFSKCCGGLTEEFQYCWDDTPKAYLKSVADPYCNTDDKNVLRQVLNDYDLETDDFHDWTTSYSVEEVSRLVRENTKKDIGSITDIIPMERGKSGRIWKLRLCGTIGELIIGKELEIRRVLSTSHLKSSWFDVERTTDDNGHTIGFVLHGHGWGHGVGLCQIGAAVMGEKGIDYKEILKHYYNKSEIKKLY